MQILALFGGVSEQVMVGQAGHKAGQAEAHPDGGLVRVHHRVVVGAAVVREADRLVHLAARLLGRVEYVDRLCGENPEKGVRFGGIFFGF